MDSLRDRIDRLEERVQRERQRRQQAEEIAQEYTRDLYERQHELKEVTGSLEQRVEERTQDLEHHLSKQIALQEVSRFALQRQGIQGLTEEICRRTAQVLDAHYCDVFQLRPNGEGLILRAGVGWSEEAIDKATMDAEEGSQSGYTVRNWEATVVEDHREDERFRREQLFEDVGILSGITVVVPAPVNPWGIFGVHAKEPRAFDENDVTFVQTMSRVLSQAIQRQRAQEALELEKERFKSLVQTVEEYAIFNLDPEGHVQTWNVGAEKIKGYAAGEIIGEHIRIFYTPEDKEEGIPERNLERAAQQGSTEDEGWRLRKDGSTFWANVTITAIRDEEDELRGFSKVTRDMTDRMEYERRLEASNQQLEQFAYAASHDLKEPLRMVSNYLELLETQHADRLDEEGLEMLTYASDGAERMRDMVDSLLEYARVSTAGKPLEITDAQAVLDDALSDLSLRIAETDANVTVSDLPTVHADPDQLAQVFRNLVSNALEHSSHDDHPPRIHIDATRVGDQWRFSVADNGVGIPPGETDEIFDLFQRSSTQEGEGTGIGLAICQQIVDRHGGKVWVDSNPGEGSTFHFTIPAPP